MSKYPEQDLQIACVKFFRHQHSKYATLLHNNRNSSTSAREGAKHKAMGSVPGVADLVLYLQRGGCGALFLELKSEVGKQSADQKLWAVDITAQGYKYVVVRSIEQFIKEVNEYINLT
jgi:hypothetical protein